MGSLKLTVWGVRGSFPRPSRDFLEYGGNTSCFSIRLGESLVVLDAGSGLSALGDAIAHSEDIKTVHILLSHGHLDHVMGLCPFLGTFAGGRDVHIYGGCLEGIKALAGPPFWPGSVEKSGAGLHPVRPGETFRLSECGAQVTAMEGTHPGGCLWYRLDIHGKSLVYILDCETEPSRMPDMLRFARGADLVVWDAAWPPGQEIPGWGHSTWVQGADFGKSSGAARVLMSHYALRLDDVALRRMEREAESHWDGCIFAREGMEIDI